MTRTKSKGQKKTLASASSHDETLRHEQTLISESSSLSPIVGSLNTPTKPVYVSSKPQTLETPIQETPEEGKRKILAMLSDSSSEHKQQYVSDSNEKEEEEKEEEIEDEEEEKEEGEKEEEKETETKVEEKAEEKEEEEEEESSSEGEPVRKVRFHSPSLSLPILTLPILSSKTSTPPSITPKPGFKGKKVPEVHWIVNDDGSDEELAPLIRRP